MAMTPPIMTTDNDFTQCSWGALSMRTQGPSPPLCSPAYLSGMDDKGHVNILRTGEMSEGRDGLVLHGELVVPATA